MNILLILYFCDLNKYMYIIFNYLKLYILSILNVISYSYLCVCTYAIIVTWIYILRMSCELNLIIPLGCDLMRRGVILRIVDGITLLLFQ